MKSILLLNQKGGVGKTTLADELVYILQEHHHTVSFISIDPQGGSVWSDTDIIYDEKDNTDFLVIDTPGVLSESSAEWCVNADLILIPMLPSTRDIEPTMRTVSLANESGTPAYIILNCFNPFGKLDIELYNYLSEEEGIKLGGTIPKSVLFSQAAANEKSVTSMRFSKERGIKTSLENIYKLIKENLL